MLFPLSIFIFAMAVAFAMIARKVWQIRNGHAIAADSHESTDWHDLSIESIRLRLIELAKFVLRHFVLFVLKVWIRVSNWVKRTDTLIKAKLTHLLHKNGHLPPGGKPSRFIKKMHVHKEELANAMEKEAGGGEVAEKG